MSVGVGVGVGVGLGVGALPDARPYVSGRQEREAGERAREEEGRAGERAREGEGGEEKEGVQVAAGKRAGTAC